MRAILVDDEAIALELLKHMLWEYKDIEIVDSFTNPIDVIKNIGRINPDVIFLDIEMGEINGLELIESLVGQLETVEIVFVTAYSQYAVEAFEVNAIDYLLKPIQENRLKKTVERLRIAIEEKINVSDPKLRVNSFGAFEVVDEKDIPMIWRTQKAKELFAYLWCKRDAPISKNIIIETIFNHKDYDKATTLLHTTIYQLRKNLEKAGFSNGISYFNDSYHLDIPIVSDEEELRKTLMSRKYSEEDILDILRIYKGDFLEEGYSWAIELQQVYRSVIFSILEEYVKEGLEEKVFPQTVKVALDKMYSIEPFNEVVAEMMIHYYGKQNKRINLEKFFDDYTASLRKEMKLEPLEGTVELYKRYMEEI